MEAGDPNFYVARGYIHVINGLLSEHEFWANEASTVYIDSPYERGSAVFRTPDRQKQNWLGRSTRASFYEGSSF
jgi:hypothetical protein